MAGCFGHDLEDKWKESLIPDDDYDILECEGCGSEVDAVFHCDECGCEICVNCERFCLCADCHILGE